MIYGEGWEVMKLAKIAQNSASCMSIPGLAFPLVPHTCVSVLGYHWFRRWLVACSAPSHCLNQCCLFVNRTLGNKFQWNSNLNAIHSIQNMHSIMLSILAAFLSGPLCVKAAPHDRTSYFIRCRTLNSEAHVSLFYYGCEHTRDWYGSLQGRFPHNGLFILLLCIYYDLCFAPCTFTVNKLNYYYYGLINMMDHFPNYLFDINADSSKRSLIFHIYCFVIKDMLIPQKDTLSNHSGDIHSDFYQSKKDHFHWHSVWLVSFGLTAYLTDWLVDWLIDWLSTDIKMSTKGPDYVIWWCPSTYWSS